MRYLAFFLLKFGVLALSITSCESNEEALTYQFLPNPKVRESKSFALNHKVRSEIQYEGTIFETSMQQQWDFILKFQNILEDGFLAEMSFTRLQIRAYSQNQTVLIKSDKKDSTDVRSNLLKLLVNKPFYVHFRQNGSIREIRGWEEWLENMALQATSGNALQAEYLGSEIKKSISHELIAAHLEIGWCLSPNEPVKKPSEWSRPILFSSGLGEKSSAMAYLFESTEGPLAKITGIAQTGGGTQDPFFDPSTGLSYEVTGETRLKALFNNEEGWVTKSSIEQQLKGNAKLPISEARPLGLSMPVKIQSSLEIQQLQASN
jgi:hypothetical protein